MDCNSSVTSNSSSTSGIGSTVKTINWTPSLGIDRGTPTPSNTEGTPSLTESSESSEIGKNCTIFNYLL